MNKKLILFAFLSTIMFNAFAQPANDLCTGAITVTPNGSCVNGTTVAAGDEWTGQVGCQAGGGTHEDVWYSFVATGTVYDGTITTSGAWTGNAEFILVTGTCGGTFTLVNSTCGASPLTINVTGLTAGATYYFTVSPTSGGTPGPFSVCSTTSTPAFTCTDNDACVDAATITLLAPGAGAACITDCNTGAAPGVDFLGNICEDMTGPTVWYEITTAGLTATLDVSVTSTDISTPEFVVWDTDCSTWTSVNCTQGAGGTASQAGIAVAGNSTYIIAVSNNNGGQGNFNLCITQNVDNSLCGVNDVLNEVSSSDASTPVGGPYSSGEVVNFCYTILQWRKENCNWLQGIVPTFGDCWDASSFAANGMPVTSTPPAVAGNESGSWAWYAAGQVLYNNIGGSLPPNSPLPGGWFFQCNSCGVSSTDPNNSWGDGGASGSPANDCDINGNGYTWTVCFTLIAGQTGNQCTSGATDCTVSIKTYADGEIGGWENAGCTADLPLVSTSSFYCCTTLPPTVSNNGPVCVGQPLTLSATTATGTYSWTGPNGFTSTLEDPTVSATATTAMAGTYSVTLTNDGCTSAPATTTVVVNTLPTLGGATGACVNQTTNVTPATGGTWTSSNTAVATITDAGVVTGVSAGTVTLTFTNTTTGCVNTMSFTVTALPTLGGSTSVCQGLTANVTPNAGGTWSSSNTSVATITNGGVVTGVSGGTVTLTFTNTATGCSNTMSFTVNPLDDASFDYSGSTFCQTGTDPSANIIGLGGGNFTSAPAGLIINSSTGLIDLSASALNTYTITYTTNGTCPNTSTFNITITTAPSATFTYASPFCQGAANPSPTFPVGSSAGTFSSTPAGLNFVSTSTGQINLATSTPGTYDVTNTIAAAGGCSPASHTVTIIIHPRPTSVISPDPASVCAGTALNMNGNPTGGSGVYSTHAWTGAGATSLSSTTTVNPNFSNATAGTYALTYTVTDNRGCVGTDNITVTVNALPTSAITPDPASVCVGNTLNMNGNPIGGSGTYSTHVWTGSGSTSLSATNTVNPTFTNGTAGTYALTYSVTDNFGCVGTDNIIVTVNALPTATISPDPAEVCAGTTISLNGNPTGGSGTYSTHAWTGAGATSLSSTSIVNPNFTNATAGTYALTYTVTDNAGCTGTDNITVTVIAIDNSSFSYASTSFCQTGPNPSATISVTGGTFSSTPAGLVLDPSTGEIDLTASTLDTFTITYTTNGVCPSSSTLIIEIKGGNTADFTYAGPYCVNGTNPFPTFISGSIAGTFSSTPAGLDFVNTSTGEIDLSNSLSGTYDVTNNIPAFGGCDSAFFTTTVTIDPLDDATFSYPQNSYCVTDTDPIATITGISGGTFTSTAGIVIIDASNGEIDLSASTIGTYDITYTTPGPCVNSSTFSITLSNSFDASITPAGPFCANSSSVNLNAATGGGTWSGTGVNASGTFDPAVAGAGNHDIIYTISGTCGDADTMTIVVNPLPTADGGNDQIIGCIPNSVSLDGVTQTSATYLWTTTDGNIVSGATTINPLVDQAGTYTLTVTLNGCSSTDIVFVTNSTAPNASFTVNPSTGFVPQVVNTDNNSTGSGLTYFWTSGNGESSLVAEPLFTYDSAGTYIVTLIVVDQFGCTDTASMSITVFDQFFISIPNIFSPNDDDDNQTFFITSQGVTEMTVDIYNRWGNHMKGWTGTAGFWDGKKEGKEVPDGVYYYIITITKADGETETYNGNITLVR